MSLKNAIRYAYSKGYRVSDDGILYGVKGLPLIVKVRGNQKYPTFTVNGFKEVKNKYGVYGIPIHRFAAYCFYGEKIWEYECVRHLNGNVEDVSKGNIVLGSHSENNMDKDLLARKNAAKIARAAQGKRPLNSKFTDQQVIMIRRSSKTNNELANEFNVSRQAIWLIRKGKNYGDVS